MWAVPSLDEVEHGKRSLALRLETMLHKKFAFERCVETLAHGVVVTIADRTHRWSNAGLFAARPECDRRVLRALIGMVADRSWLTPVDCHVERVDDKFSSHMIGRRSAHDASAEDVEYNRKEQETRPRRDVSDARNPELVGRICSEAAIDQIRSRPRVPIAQGRRDRLRREAP